ncbi:MAG: bifunctional acetate--CoA ligase family protein/GNAT family N-acetyltransferase [Vulcanimicrobiaceae bacterium]
MQTNAARPALGIQAVADLEDLPIGMRSMSPPIDVFFRPRGVAVIGATERPASAGRILLVNLMASSFGGTLYPINPNRERVLGLPSFPTVEAVPGPVDLAVIATPAQTVPDVISQCAAKGVKGAILLSSGFKESGPAGTALARQVLERAREGKLRVLGPNSLGVICPVTGLNASLGSVVARSGTVGFASQSGALCASVLGWSHAQQFGFSAFISMGSMIDIDWSDVIYYLGDDPSTKSIVLYIESIGQARTFLSAAREVALSKPIVLFEPGRTTAAGKAAASDTGSMIGRDDVRDAAFERSGLLRVDSIEELFSMTAVLAMQPRPAGKRLAIVTNAGAPGVLATNALVEGGGETASLGRAALAALDAILPSYWSHGDPVDIFGDATPERYAKTIEIVRADPNNDGLLVTYAPHGNATAVEVAECVANLAKTPRKPLLASWMGGDEVKAGSEILERAGIPSFAYPDAAARIFNLMWRYDDNLRALMETPTLAADEAVPNRAVARALIAGVLTLRRTQLTEAETKQLLDAYEIPIGKSVIATTPQAAVAGADTLGYPVAMKVHSEKIVHKSEVGGVRLRIGDAQGVRHAFERIAAAVTLNVGPDAFKGVTVQPMIDVEDGYELIMSSSVDPQFGPVLLFGHGGQLVDVFRDRALGLPPLTEALARRMIEKTRISKALAGLHGHPPIDLGALLQCLVRFSNLIVDLPRIKEININPFIATPDRVLALDCHVVLHSHEIPDEALPRTAIRPYPAQYEGTWIARDGTELAIRPVRPEYEPLMRPFHTELSEKSVYRRYALAVRLADRISHEKLARQCFIDYAHEMALVALRTSPSGEPDLVGVGQLVIEHERNEAEFALLISDSFQGKGLGSELLRRLVEIGRKERIDRIVGHILADNQPMLAVCRRLGFRNEHMVGSGPMVESVIDLG